MKLKRSLLLSVLLVVNLAGVRAWAQAPDSPIVFVGPSAITTTLVDSPQSALTGGGGGGGGGGPTDNTQWLKIEWHYQVAPKQPQVFLDSVEFRVWAQGVDIYSPDVQTPDGIPVVLTGSVTYINLQATRDGYGVIYIHPSTLARYSSKAGASDFASRFNVHVEAYLNGQKVDLFDKVKADDPAWYQSAKTVGGLLYRQDQCPFMMTDVTRYPQIKPEGNSSQ